MKRTLRYLVMFMTSAVVGLSASVATSADAAWTARMHASACMTFGGTPIDNLFGIQNDSAVATTALLCPAHDQTGQEKATSSLGLTVYDDTTVGSVTAFACGSLVLGRGGSCAPSSTTGAGFLGVSLLGVSTASVWIDTGLATSYGYVVVLLPPKQGAAFRSSLQGYAQNAP